MCWNIRSMKPGVYESIRDHYPNIVILQETRGQKMENTQAYNWINRNRPNLERGGGIAIGMEK